MIISSSEVETSILFKVQELLWLSQWEAELWTDHFGKRDSSSVLNRAILSFLNTHARVSA